MSFDGDIKRFSKRVGIAMDMAVRKIAFDAFAMVTMKTPVETGRAKGNWNISVKEPNKSINENATSTAQGRPATNPMNLKKGDGVKPIYITNSLNYIYALEHGSSKKAPKGMVKVTMNELRRSM
jgi:hypothetical protein